MKNKGDKMTQPKVTVIMGLSNSGKDTVTNIILNTSWINYRYGTTLILVNDKIDSEKNHYICKFSGGFKRYIEASYCLQAGVLDTKEGKSLKVPNSDDTFLDLLIKASKLVPQINPRLTVDALINALGKKIPERETENIVFNDIRRLVEADAVINLGIPYDLIYVTRPGVVAKESDNSVIYCFNYLMQNKARKRFNMIMNNGSLEDLEVKVNDIIKTTRGD